MNSRTIAWRVQTLLPLAVALCCTAASPAWAKSKNASDNNSGTDGSATASTTYSAGATAVRITSSRGDGPFVFADAGSIESSGGVRTAADANVNIANGGLTVVTADAEAEGAGPEAAAGARVSGFHVEIAMNTGNITIEADYIGADVSASSNPGGHTAVDGRVTIRNLTVNGQAVTVTGEANQEVKFPNDTRLIINEQTTATAKGNADIDLVALHFWACDFEGRIGIVNSGITVNGNPPPPEEHTCGKLTGGGWITGTPSGAKGTFGVSGGVRRGEFWGHLTYIDHGMGMKVESTAVTGFENDPTNENGRIITYAVNIDGVAGTATVRAVDNGEPGRDDIFEIKLSNGYQAGGDLGGDQSGGGNIQLHKCPTGWE